MAHISKYRSGKTTEIGKIVSLRSRNWKKTIIKNNVVIKNSIIGTM